MKDNYAIIMAGGVGSRFWPWSTTQRPKQFLDVLGTGRTLIQQTFDRLKHICPPENTLVITNQLYEKTIAQQLPGLPAENILCEPDRRNTAPCIAYGAYKIKASNPDANILVAPADHIILKENLFLEVVQQGFDFVRTQEALVTIGIKPHKPETGYGYIQSTGEVLLQQNDWQLSKVVQFREKPDLETAQSFLADGNYFWNAGIFIWSVNTIIAAFEKHLPELNAYFINHKADFHTEREKKAIDTIYQSCQNISIDYGIMEKADNVYVISTDIGWSDLGSWSALQEVSEHDNQGNTAEKEQVLLYDSKNSLIKIQPGKKAVIDGLDDFIVVDDEKVLLICRKSNEQKIKQFVGDIKDRFGDQFV